MEELLERKEMKFLKVLMMFVFVIFVVNIIKYKDGDTIRVQDPSDQRIYDVRLYGIDVPEHDQAYGTEAFAYMKSLINGQQVKLQLITGGEYGRITCQVFTLDNKYVNALLVENGCAWWYQYYAPKDIVLQQAQAKAQLLKVGLWQEDKPVAPWDFRKNKKVSKIK